MKKGKVVIALGVILFLFYCGFYFKDKVGISEDQKYIILEIASV